MSAYVRSRSLFRSDHIRVSEFLCTHPRSRVRVRERTSHHEMIFVRRGAFVLRASGRETVITPNQSMILPSGCEFSIEHPIAGGDECIIIAMSDELFARARFDRGASIVRQANSESFLAHHQVVTAAKRGEHVETEERAFALIRSATGATMDRMESPAPSRGVRIALEMLAARFDQRLSLDAISREAGMSSWHLSRSFRRATGQTLHRYQNALRLRSALRRLLEGENDLTSIALDHGFFDHSHFTNMFHREFGIAPSVARETFRRS